MNFKNLLPAAIAGLIGVSSPSCKPVQEKHKAEVEKILSTVQPTEENIQNSRAYYDERADLKNISQQEKMSLILSHAKLSVLVEQLKKDIISTDNFLTILKSEDRIITDKNTKLKIATNFWKGVNHLYSHGNELELWTEGLSPNKILRNFTTQVVMNGGELKVSFSGTEFESVARADKEQLSASTDSNLVGPATYTISVNLVLAQ